MKCIIDSCKEDAAVRNFCLACYKSIWYNARRTADSYKEYRKRVIRIADRLTEMDVGSKRRSFVRKR